MKMEKSLWIYSIRVQSIRTICMISVCFNEIPVDISIIWHWQIILSSIYAISINSILLSFEHVKIVWSCCEMRKRMSPSSVINWTLLPWFALYSMKCEKKREIEKKRHDCDWLRGLKKIPKKAERRERDSETRSQTRSHTYPRARTIARSKLVYLFSR